jgi:hypothetical protein
MALVETAIGVLHESVSDAADVLSPWRLQLPAILNVL